MRGGVSQEEKEKRDLVRIRKAVKQSCHFRKEEEESVVRMRRSLGKIWQKKWHIRMHTQHRHTLKHTLTHAHSAVTAWVKAVVIVLHKAGRKHDWRGGGEQPSLGQELSHLSEHTHSHSSMKMTTWENTLEESLCLFTHHSVGMYYRPLICVPGSLL